MSIIHQALKKLESTRGGYGPASSPSQGMGRDWRYRKPNRVITIAFVASAVIGGLFFSKSFLGKRESARPVTDNAPADVKKTSVDEAKPRTWQEHNSRGLSLYRAGDMAGAIDEFSKAANDRAGEAIARNNLGEVLLETGRMTEAEENFKKALALRPSYAEALNNYASVLEKKGERKKAMEFYRKSIASDGAHWPARLNLAISYERQGRYREAINAYDDFISTGAAASMKEDAAKRAALLKSTLLYREAGK